MSNRKSNWKSRKIVQFAYFNLGLEYWCNIFATTVLQLLFREVGFKWHRKYFSTCYPLYQIWHSSTKDINFRFSWISSFFFQNPAPTEACAQLKKPPYEEDCRIPCPEECVLSAWTDWSSCPSNCLNSRINRRLPLSFRNRTLLALSSTAASGQNLGKEA